MEQGARMAPEAQGPWDKLLPPGFTCEPGWGARGLFLQTW